MNIQHLRYVVEVERTGSISQAAENLYMNQPNLSKALKELEQTLNITIFKRTPKGVQVTPKGREFLRYAKGILHQYEEMEALGREGSQGTHSLRLSVPRASYIVDAFTTFLSGLDPDKPLMADFLETNALRTIRHVADGRADLGIIRCREKYQAYFFSMLEDNGLEWKPLLTFRYLLLLSTGHPLARQALIQKDALESYVEILHGDTALPRMQETDAEAGSGYTPGDRKVHVYDRGSQFDLLARVPGTYMWVSPMPIDLLERNGLVQRPCSDSPAFNDLLIQPRGHQLNPMEQAFIAQLEQSAQSIHAHFPT